MGESHPRRNFPGVIESVLLLIMTVAGTVSGIGSQQLTLTMGAKTNRTTNEGKNCSIFPLLAIYLISFC
jgi:hypothetical protein